MMLTISIAQIHMIEEQDIVQARQWTKDIAGFAGLSVQDQSRFVTAVSEIIRNAFQYGRGAHVEIGIGEETDKQYVVVVVRDQGPGIANIEEVLQGRYKSNTSMGSGILATRKLVDLFSIESDAQKGTVVFLGKEIDAAHGRISQAAANEWRDTLSKTCRVDLLREIQDQNRLLLQTLEETQNARLVQAQQVLNIEELHGELEQTNKGILALYKELDDSRAELLKKTELLERQGQELQAATRHKSEFLANMSHEIRTPMNGVVGMTQILLTSGLTEKQEHYAETIQAAGKSLLCVIDDILDFSKIEAGKLDLQIAEFELVRLVEGVAELLAPQAKQRHLSLLTFIDPELPTILGGDSGRLRQILMNLVGNAIKFSDHGSIVIKTALESQDGLSVRIKFSVADNGIGMTPEEINKLFEPYVQASGCTTEKYGGTGLGLSISKHLIELMDGEIGVDSSKAHGSTFWFSVPLRIIPSLAIKHLAPVSLDGLRVLIVDDDPSSREILDSYMISWRIHKGDAANAEQALDLLRAAAKSRPYDIAIIDLVMPEMDGLKLGKLIREDDSLSSTKLILNSAFGQPDTAEKAIHTYFDAYLSKPLKQSQLLDVLTSVMSGGQEDKTEGLTAVESNLSQPSANVPKREELILVAEDHPVNQEVALQLLNILGFEAHAAENGHRVLELINKGRYSLIFMDFQMPTMDGLETTRRIRKLETRTGKHVPIVAMTANALDGSRETGLEAGMDDYMSKPIELAQLRSIIDKWLPAKDHGSMITAPPPAVSVSLDTTPLRLEALEAKVGKDGAIKLLSIFLSKAPSDLINLKEAVIGRDVERVLFSVHALQSVFAYLCAAHLSTLAATLHDTVRAENWSNADALFEDFEKSFTQVEQFVRSSICDLAK